MIIKFYFKILNSYFVPLTFLIIHVVALQLVLNFEALTAGYNPEAIVTINVVITAAITAVHGITKENPMADAIPQPIKIPKIIPTIPPN